MQQSLRRTLEAMHSFVRSCPGKESLASSMPCIIRYQCQLLLTHHVSQRGSTSADMCWTNMHTLYQKTGRYLAQIADTLLRSVSNQVTTADDLCEAVFGTLCNLRHTEDTTQLSLSAFLASTRACSRGNPAEGLREHLVHERVSHRLGVVLHETIDLVEVFGSLPQRSPCPGLQHGQVCQALIVTGLTTLEVDQLIAAARRVRLAFWAFFAASKTLSTSFCEHAAAKDLPSLLFTFQTVTLIHGPARLVHPIISSIARPPSALRHVSCRRQINTSFLGMDRSDWGVLAFAQQRIQIES